jgi:hypothetical protein
VNATLWTGVGVSLWRCVVSRSSAGRRCKWSATRHSAVLCAWSPSTLMPLASTRLHNQG